MGSEIAASPCAMCAARCQSTPLSDHRARARGALWRRDLFCASISAQVALVREREARHVCYLQARARRVAGRRRPLSQLARQLFRLGVGVHCRWSFDLSRHAQSTRHACRLLFTQKFACVFDDSWETDAILVARIDRFEASNRSKIAEICLETDRNECE